MAKSYKDGDFCNTEDLKENAINIVNHFMKQCGFTKEKLKQNTSMDELELIANMTMKQFAGINVIIILIEVFAIDLEELE